VSGAAEYRLAIDVGGTFTDVVLMDGRDGSLRFGKVLSTPDDPSIGSLEGARDILARNGVSASDVGDVIHATTVATNAVLERKGARVGLITTRGFADTLEIRRESRYDIYDMDLRMPAPLVERAHRLEVVERTDHAGAVVVPLDEGSVVRALSRLAESGIQSVAICLLHSYASPAHELRIAAIARAAHPQLDVSVSSEVAGEVREFERTSTVVVDAYVKPLVRRYIERLEGGLRALGIDRQLSLMLSHGGIGAASQVANLFPVRMIESGPAAGAIAAAHFSRAALDAGDAIAFDMGGTTAKMSLVRGGAPTVTHEYEVAHMHRFKRGSGIPLQISAVELLEIGAGGGSIAHLNELGLLTVGPESAGAKPGPVCYGRGGVEPTVTDADLVLGYLNPAFFLGGDMRLDVAAARRAMDERIGGPLSLTTEQVARGIHDVVNERMAAGIRAHCAEKGVDLRRFGLIAFGGAGPVHAYAIARKLGVSRIVCPFGAGVASSIGCLVAHPAMDLVAAHTVALEQADWPQIAAHFAAMHRSAAEVIGSLVGAGAHVALTPQFEIRCAGQGYSVGVELEPDGPIDASLVPELSARFARVYEDVYGHKPPLVPLEIVTLRARVAHLRPVPPLRVAYPLSAGDAGAAHKGTRPVYFEESGRYVETPILDRYRLEQGRSVQGPAIIEERETSIVVGPAGRFRIDGSGNVLIDIAE
jgi:N-methylhydantoinase A